MPLALGPSGPKPLSYLFIDGGCMRSVIREVSKTFFNDEQPDIAWDNVRSGFTKVFYYDCIAPKLDSELDNDYESRKTEQTALFNQIRLHRGFHVFEGVMRRRRKQNVQKKVDVKIAVDMLTHTFMKNMDRCTLLANDLDFQPLLEALVQNGMFVTLMYRPRFTSNDLQYTADDRHPINVRTIYGWCSTDFQSRHPMPKPTREDLHLLTTLETIEATDGEMTISRRQRKADRDSELVAQFGTTSYQHDNRDLLVDYMFEMFPQLGTRIDPSD